MCLKIQEWVIFALGLLLLYFINELMMDDYKWVHAFSQSCGALALACLDFFLMYLLAIGQKKHSQ